MTKKIDAVIELTAIKTELRLIRALIVENNTILKQIRGNTN